MIKRIIGLLTAFVLVFGSFAAINVTADDTESKSEHTTAVFGTPTIDGEIDEVWNKTKGNVIGIVGDTNDDFYRGWFKLLWDNENLYVLSKIYGEDFDNSNDNAWENESIEVFVDEKYNKSTKYEEDDYQIRSDFEGNLSGLNYNFDEMVSKGKLSDGFYVVEMKIPFKTVTPKADMTIGFDVQVNTSATTFFPRMMYRWSESSRYGAQYSNTSIFGSADLITESTGEKFDEPGYSARTVDVAYPTAFSTDAYETVSGVSVTYDGQTTQNVTIIHADDYPMLEINQFASIIGARVENGNTLIKDKVTLTFTAGDRIAHYTHADYPNQSDYLTTYYTNMSNVMSGTPENKVAEISETPIAGEDKIVKLGEDYVNDGTDGNNDGYIMERAPYSVGGKLYVPLYCVVPTLNYNVEYYRFNDPAEIVISTGTNYPAEETYQKFYAKDYGAVGDGVTDDKDAILKAYGEASTNAALGTPSMLVLEEGKTYRVSEKTDISCFFYFYKVNNFTLEGNGSTILFEHPLNTSMYIRECENVKIKNITFMYEEHTQSHGEVVEVNPDEGWFVIDVPEHVELPSPPEWRAAIGGSYGFGQVYDLAEKHLKFIPADNWNIDSLELLGDRKVKIYCSAYKSRKDQLAVGDGFVFKRMWENYDMNQTGKDAYTQGIGLFMAKDIELDGVTLCGAPELGVSVGLCEGKITFRNYQMRTKDGQLTASCADGIHYWRNRATLLIENCELWNNIDDHVNTKGELATITAISDDRKTITTNYEQNYVSGDEILFFKRDDHNEELGNAYVKSVDKSQSGKYILELDREVPEEITADSIKGGAYKTYDNMSAGYGTCIRGSRFIQSRRHAYISRSRNVIFMNNYVQNNGGSTVAAEDEIGTSEGPFPHAFTIRNNRTYGDGITESSHVSAPIQVKPYNSKTPAGSIEGILIEGNTIQLSTSKYSFYIEGVSDLYMRNNRILWNDKWNDNGKDYSKYVPVYIAKCEVKEFDGLEFDTPQEVKQVVHFAACDVDEENVKNITVREGNNSPATWFELTKED